MINQINILNKIFNIEFTFPINNLSINKLLIHSIIIITLLIKIIK